MADNPAPRRRWYQFRPSTWFVLVGILAWAMALRPFYKSYDVFEAMVGPELLAQKLSSRPPDHLSVDEWKQKLKRAPKFSVDLDNSDVRVWYWRARLTLRRLLFPARALVAFVGWKAARLVVERRRNRRTPHS